MRDIRPDLKERASSLKAEIEALRADLEAKERHLESTGELLARENDYWANKDQKQLFDSAEPGVSNGHGQVDRGLMEFLEKSLTGAGLTAKEIGQLAVDRGFDFGEKSPSRAVHFRLLNLQKAGKASRHGDRWKMRNTS